MSWNIDLTTIDGCIVLYKHFASVPKNADPSQMALQDAMFTAAMYDEHSGNVVHVIDVNNVKASKRTFKYIRKAIQLKSPLPKHTYVIGVSSVTKKAFKAVKKLLSQSDMKITTLHEGEWDREMQNLVKTNALSTY